MVENNTTNIQLILSNRIKIKLEQEKSVLKDRYNIIAESELYDFIREDMSNVEKGIEYLQTIRALQLNNIENRLIQIEGEIEGVKLHIIEIEESIKNKEITNDNK